MTIDTPISHNATVNDYGTFSFDCIVLPIFSSGGKPPHNSMMLHSLAFTCIHSHDKEFNHMQVNSFTGAQALQAREHIGLSLNSTAKFTGINRNYLSQFEQEKYMISATEKEKLINFYQSRGFEFPLIEDEPENYLIEHREFKKDQLDKIKKDLGIELSNSIEAILKDAEDKIIKLQNANLDNQVRFISDDFDRLESTLIEHFKKDKDGMLDIKLGFFGENKKGRGARLMALASLQYLREIKHQNEDLITLSLEVAETDSDNALMLSCISECLGYPELAELKDLNEDLVA